VHGKAMHGGEEHRRNYSLCHHQYNPNSERGGGGRNCSSMGGVGMTMAMADDEDINSLATIISSVEILCPIT
jgi:hypothetical protein